MENTNLENLNRLAKLFGTDRLISPEDIQEIRSILIGVLANNKKEVESLTEETKQAINSVLDKVLTEHDTYLEKTKEIAQEAKSETTEAINSTLKSLEEVKALCKEVMECKPENGEDADEEYVIGEVLNRIKLPEYKEIVLDDGGAIVDKINSLPVNEENQIDAKHIKNLPEGKGGRVISGGVTRKIVEQMIAAAGGGTPGGSTTQLQYNNAGSFGGISGATTDGTAVTFATDGLLANTLKSATSAGTLFESNSGTDVLLLGAGGGAGATFYGGVNMGGTLSITGGDIFLNGGNVIKNNTTHLYLDASSGNDVIFRPNNGTEAGRFKSSGDFVVDTNTLYVDATNNRLGIGTASPTNPLTILTNALGAQLRLGDVAGSQFQYEIGRETAVGRLKFEGFQNNFSGFDFVQNNAGVQTTVLRIAEITGNVGIGVTAPLTKLHLSGGDVSTGFTTATIALGFNTTGQYPHFIHTRHNGGPTSNAIDFYTSDGTAAGVYPTNAIHGMTISNAQIGLQTTAPTHTLTLGSTSTGIALYNTADQTTNYERVRAFWSANVFTIDSQNGGTGTLRAFALQAASTNYIVMAGSNAKLDLINGLSTGFANIALLKPTATASSSVQNIFAITPTINQSTSAGYTVLLVNPTETTTGSGSKLLADFQVGGVSKFNVANTGITTITNINDAAASNQVLVLQGDRATPANNDDIYISFKLSDSAGNQDEFGRIGVQASDVTSGSEDGIMQFRLAVAGSLTQIVNLTSARLAPATNDGNALGTSTQSWSDLFLASGGVINWNNGNATLTHSTGLLTSNVPIVAPKRVVTTTDDATAVIDVAVTDVYQLTAIANNTTFSFTGTPTDGQNFIIRYKDAGVSKTLTWTGFTAIGVTLPTATTAGKWGYVGVTYNSAASQYHVTAVTTEA